MLYNKQGILLFYSELYASKFYQDENHTKGKKKTSCFESKKQSKIISISRGGG